MTMKVSKLINVFGKTAALLLLAGYPTFSQDDDAVAGRLMNAENRQQLGKAEIITASNEFGLYLRMWLNDGKVRIVRPHSGSRSSTINCSFREYKHNASDPRNDQFWIETASGTVALQIQQSADTVRSITGSMVITEKSVGEGSAKVNEKPQKFVIVIE